MAWAAVALRFAEAVAGDVTVAGADALAANNAAANALERMLLRMPFL